MVDINLMGEDEASEDREREGSFAKTVNLDDAPTKSADETATAFSNEMPGKSYPSRETGSSFARRSAELYGEGANRTKAYLIVLGLILAALAAVFFLFQGGSKKPDVKIVQKPVAKPAPVDTAKPAPPQVTEAPPAATTPPPRSETQPSLSPLERELVGSMRIGTTTVSSLIRSLSSPNDFTLITYHGNNRFFVEFRSPSSSAAGNLTEAVQRGVSPLEVKVVSQSNLSTNGSTVSKVLVSGRMDVQAGLVGLTGSINRMNSSQFSDWIKGLGQSNGLALKRFVAGARTSEFSGSVGIPMQLHFSGSNANVRAFLDGVYNANLMASLSKIIISPSDRKTLSPGNLDLIIHLGIVEM